MRSAAAWSPTARGVAAAVAMARAVPAAAGAASAAYADGNTAASSETHAGTSASVSARASTGYAEATRRAGGVVMRIVTAAGEVDRGCRRLHQARSSCTIGIRKRCAPRRYPVARDDGGRRGDRHLCIRSVVVCTTQRCALRLVPARSREFVPQLQAQPTGAPRARRQ